MGGLEGWRVGGLEGLRVEGLEGWRCCSGGPGVEGLWVGEFVGWRVCGLDGWRAGGLKDWRAGGLEVLRVRVGGLEVWRFCSGGPEVEGWRVGSGNGTEWTGVQRRVGLQESIRGLGGEQGEVDDEGRLRWPRARYGHGHGATDTATALYARGYGSWPLYACYSV